MADRFPLIANSSANQIQEIASGDTIDLTGNMVDNAVNVKATGITTLSNTTDSTSSTTGGLIVSGGVGVAKNLFVGDAIDVTKDIKVGAAATVTGSLTASGGVVGNVTGTATGLTGTPNISCGTIAGSTGTFSGVVNIDDTTDSTSATSGSLIVDGGLGVAKNVYIGAGLSVAGTLTYEDVTSVDSVGLITAKSGVNITGGQLQVGVAYSVGAAGVCTAAGFVGSLTGAASQITVADESSDTSCNVVYTTAATGDLAPKTGTNLTFNSSTGNLTATQLTGTLQTAAQTNITSVGSLSALTVTGDLTFDNGTNAGKDLTWDVSQDALIYNDSVYASFGNDQDFKIWHDGSHAYIRNTFGTLYIQAKSGENALTASPDGSVYLAYDNSTKLTTTNDGVVVTGIMTASAGANYDGLLSEKFETTAGKLSDNTNIDLEDGMIHYFTTAESTTSTPNIRYSSSKSLNNMLSIGDAITITIITTAAAAGYQAQLTIDGSAVTEQWVGGSAPAEGGADGYDILTYNILKTADATFFVVGNLVNAT